MTCPVCEVGEIEVSAKIYYDVTGTIEDLPNAGATAVIDGVELASLNDYIGSMPLNLEGEFFCGCDNCGTEFPVAWSDALLQTLNRQADR